MLSDYELFLNGCYSAVVEISYLNDDLYEFIDLMKKLGLGNYSAYLERVDEKHSIIDSARYEGIKHLCIEFQWGKGFTYGDKDDYLKSCDETKVLTLTDLKRATGYYEDYENILLTSIDEDLELLDEFCCDYGWQPIHNSKGYNIMDVQLDNLLIEEENYKDFNELVSRIIGRAIDYFRDETEWEIIDDYNYGKELLNIAIKYKENDKYEECWLNAFNNELNTFKEEINVSYE